MREFRTDQVSGAEFRAKVPAMLGLLTSEVTKGADRKGRLVWNVVVSVNGENVSELAEFDVGARYMDFYLGGYKTRKAAQAVEAGLMDRMASYLNDYAAYESLDHDDSFATFLWTAVTL